MTANDIEQAIARRHLKDVFVRQCKNGASQGIGRGRLLILDAWAMARSWANSKMTGYEFKVDRSDFLNDDKWRTALPLCNEFYWACPSKLIDASEVSGDTGLIWISESGSKAYMKKRAPYRNIEAPVELMTYILMCRVRVGDERNIEDTRRDVSEWRDWLSERNEDKILGHKVAWKMRRTISNRIQAVVDENRDLRTALENYSERESIFQLDSALSGIPQDTADTLRAAADALDALNKPARVLPQVEDLLGLYVSKEG